MSSRPNVRVRFFVSLALLGLSCLMLLASVAFDPSAAIWVDFGLALAGLAPAAVLLSDAVHRRELGDPRELHVARATVRLWPVLAGALLGLFAWEVIATQAFAAPAARWIVFGVAWGLVGISSAALVVHELSSERVVHVLDVGEGRGGHRSQAT
jgi:hypothetical protein